MADQQSVQNSKPSVGKNTVYNTIKTVFGIIFPLITFPYITRVLGVDNVGKINYGNSIVNYFSLIAGLGISTYAIRECSKVRDSKAKLSDTASQILSINIISTIIAYAALFITLFSARRLDSYRSLILIQSASILFTTLGADWLNQAMEDFGYITIRTVSIQVISLILMFVFIHHPDDYIKYAAISVLAASGANVVNMLYRRRFCKTRFTLRIDWKKHVVPIMLLFSMILSQTIYTSSDTTMLGLMKGDRQVGLYSTSVKIYNMVNTVVASIAYVVMPELSAYFTKKDYKNINRILRYALSFIVTLGIPCLVGLNVITIPLIYTVAGADYVDTAMSMHILTIALACSFIGGFFGNIIMLPSGRERYSLQSSIVSAVVNFVLNLILIPIWGMNAAAATTAIAEFVGIFIVRRHVEKEIKIDRLWDIFKGPLVGGVGIAVVAAVVRLYFKNSYTITFVTIIVGAFVYAAVLYAFKNELFMQFVRPLKAKFTRERK